jgi:hypothetical protein
MDTNGYHKLVGYNWTNNWFVQQSMGIRYIYICIKMHIECGHSGIP